MTCRMMLASRSMTPPGFVDDELTLTAEPAPTGALRTRPSRCGQCGCRPGWSSLHIVCCSACGRGLSPAVNRRGRPEPREVLLVDDGLPPLRVRLQPWQRTVRVRSFGDPERTRGGATTARVRR